MQRPAEAVNLLECRLLSVEGLDLPPLEVAAGDRRNLLQKFQIAPLNVGLVRLMENFDQPLPALTAVDRGADDQQVRRVGAARFAIRTGQRCLRRHQQTGG